jgi:hypothetical protein
MEDNQGSVALFFKHYLNTVAKVLNKPACVLFFPQCVKLLAS